MTKEELKSGIPVYDDLIDDFVNGKISFISLTAGLWNKGYKAGQDDLKEAEG